MTTSPTPTVTPEALKAGHRTMWASGDYPTVAESIDADTSAALLAQLPDLAGRDVLDVATGSGNTALRLAAAGARVTGLDLVDELLDAARRRAAAAGVDVDWVTGDAEALPFADASFDAVTSVVGIQFAPRHQVVADELVRVLRPGGVVGLVNWTPGGLIGRMFGVLGAHLPKPPAFVSPPPRWGDTEHVRALFGDRVTDLTFTTGLNRWTFPTLEAFATYFEEKYGPFIAAQAKLGPEGWAPAGRQLRAVYAELGSEGPDGFTIDGEFVVITARRA
jgi:ubiquinone/menaquinone biosynthesis C-methylase UbiE